MLKYKYQVTGITSDGESFRGTCVACNIISAIEFFKQFKLTVYTVPSRELISDDEDLGVKDIVISF